MAFRLSRVLAVAGLSLSLSCLASASHGYSSTDMMEAQLALMAGRPKDCPPWYAPGLLPPRGSCLADDGCPLPASTATFRSTLAANSRRATGMTANATAPRGLAAITVSNLVRDPLPRTRVSLRGQAHNMTQYADPYLEAKSAQRGRAIPANATTDGRASTATSARATEHATL